MSGAPEAEVYEIEVRVAARPETVFHFFTDPARMVQWKGTEAALDPRPGGTYRVNVTGHEVARGEYVEIVPYSRIVFTWGWESGPLLPGSTTVEVSFVPDGEGTIVRLRHHGLSGEALQSHEMGWRHYLPRLVEAAAGRDPGPDAWVHAASDGAAPPP